jgi:hypothetical protein
MQAVKGITFSSPTYRLVCLRSEFRLSRSDSTTRRFVEGLTDDDASSSLPPFLAF